MQQLQNGITVPTNSDAYNLTDDLADAFNQANVVIPVSSLAVRDALVKRNGLVVTRLDLGGVIEVWNQNSGRWTMGFQHAEFTGTTTPTPGQSWGTGPLSLDSNQSHYGGIFVSPGPDKITLPGGNLYAITIRVQMAIAATGPTWVSLRNDDGTVEYSSVDILPGFRNGTIAIPNHYVPTTQNIRVVFYSETNGGEFGYQISSRIKVTRMK